MPSANWTGQSLTSGTRCLITAGLISGARGNPDRAVRVPPGTGRAAAPGRLAAAGRAFGMGEGIRDPAQQGPDRRCGYPVQGCLAGSCAEGRWPASPASESQVGVVSPGGVMSASRTGNGQPAGPVASIAA
jgi:hypothetical protein